MANTKKKTVTKKKNTKKVTTTKKIVSPKTKKISVKKTIPKTKKTAIRKVSPKKVENKITPRPKKTTRIKNTPEVVITKKKKLNKKRTLIICISLILLIVCVFLFFKFVLSSPIPSVKEIYLDENNNVIINFKTSFSLNDDIYCIHLASNEIPDIDDEKWELTKNNTCTYPLDENVYYAYLKNQNGDIVVVNNSERLGRVLNLSISKDKLYLPLNTEYTLSSKYEKIGYIEEEVKWSSSNDKVATIENGIIKTHSSGNAVITASIADLTATSNIVVTNLITKRPSSFDYKKSYLPCNKYSKEENDLLDEILKHNIEEAGYKTRAGVVEAARFLTLDFPYRINYFYENGRQTTNKVDGEGRYYHVGLYLNTSKYKNIKGSKKGPKTWGCSLYSSPAHRYINNGLDCSGFVSWALLNGGFDVKDVGAGWSNNLDLTDYGTVKKLSASLGKSDTIKVGDLLHSTRAGGHIGIIVGKDSNYYYVAQAIWYDPIGVVITKHKKDKLYKDFPHVVLMDKYYKNDGNLTNMW